MFRWIIISIAIYIVVSIFLQLFPGLAKWLGRLPGDTEVKSGKKRVRIPLSTIILITLILTIILNFLKRLL